MKCPKCHYLSFEPEPRCRNCGYDLSLGQDDLDDVIVKPDETPLTDFELRSADDARGRAPVVALASESRSHGYSAHSSRREQPYAVISVSCDGSSVGRMCIWGSRAASTSVILRIRSVGQDATADAEHLPQYQVCP